MNKERLLRLAEHLDAGQLGHKVFQFNVYNLHDLGLGRVGEYNTCGTSGCAIGECPIVWPDEWTFGDTGNPKLRTRATTNATMFCGTEWFDIDGNMYKHLFLPEGQDVEQYGGEVIDDYATRYQVAANIRAFVEHSGE